VKSDKDRFLRGFYEKVWLFLRFLFRFVGRPHNFYGHFCRMGEVLGTCLFGADRGVQPDCRPEGGSASAGGLLVGFGFFLFLVFLSLLYFL
jgi:hypothetical protein